MIEGGEHEAVIVVVQRDVHDCIFLLQRCQAIEQGTKIGNRRLVLQAVRGCETAIFENKIWNALRMRGFVEFRLREAGETLVGRSIPAQEEIISPREVAEIRLI